MRAFLLSLRMRMIREYAQAHLVKKKEDLYQASSLKGSKNTVISSSLRPHTNAHTVCTRPTLKAFERFIKGSLRGLYERSIYERTFPNEPFKNLKNNAISNELSNVNYVKKHFHKRYCVFRFDREPSRIPKRTLERLKSKVKFVPGIYNA